MRCPSCSRAVAEGAAICPHCDAILDESILGRELEDVRRDTPLVVARTEPPSQKRKRAPLAHDTLESEQAKTGAGRRAKHAAGEAAVSARAAAGGSSSREEPRTGDPTQQLRQIGAAFIRLRLDDKATVIAAALLMLAAILPWRTTEESDDIGLFTWGFFTAALGALAILIVWVRKAGKLAVLPRRVLPLASAITGGLSALIGAAYALSVHLDDSADARPASGVFFAIASATLVAAAGMLTWKRER